MNPRIQLRAGFGALAFVLCVIAFTRAEGQSSSYTNVRVVNPVLVGSDGGFAVIGNVNAIVTGTVGLTPETEASLTAPPCSQGQIFPLEKLQLAGDGGVRPIPPFLPDGGFGGDLNRTSITIVNTDNIVARTVACDLLALDGGLPSCSRNSGYGEILENGWRFTWSVGQSRVIYCLPCNAGGVALGWREENCR